MRKAAWCTALGSAGLVGWAAFKRRSWIEPEGKVVLITGGSRGLGLALAREFGSRGATVVIAARDQAELDHASDDLRERGITVHAVACDVSQRDQAENLIREAVAKAGTVDVLVNNAGAIQVGPLDAMTVEDFERAMGVMFWGPLYLSLAALPILRAKRQGRIVNITSIGGKVSVPHLLPYCCAKFAAVALSEGLRTELAPGGIKVTTIVPGLMRTGSHLNAEFKGDITKEYAWFSLGAATPFPSIGAERAARTIVNAAVRGDAERILSVPADVLARVHGVAPGLVAAVTSAVSRALPMADGPTDSHRGFEARARLNSRVIDAMNVLGQRAAERLNQLG